MKKLWQVLAEAASIGSNPPLVMAIFYGYVVYHFTEFFPQATLFALIGLFFMIVVPGIYILWAWRNHKVTDFDLTDRKERAIPFSLAGVGILLTFFFLDYYGAGEPILAFLLASLFNLLVITLITPFWKISLHTATLTGVITSVVILSWGKYEYLYLLLLPVIWSRLVLRRHTFWQLLAGIALTAVLTKIIFFLKGY